MNTELSAIELNDSKEVALDKFTSERIQILPVISEGSWVGNLHREELEIQWDSIKKIQDIAYLLEKFSVRHDAGWNSVFSCLIKNASPMIPVVDSSETYLGFYDALEILQLLENLPFINEDHREMTISHNIEGFSFSQISRTIEEHGGEILQYTLLTKNTNSCSAQVLFRSQETSDTLDVLHAFGYHIISSEIDEDHLKELKERSEYLKKFLSL